MEYIVLERNKVTRFACVRVCYQNTTLQHSVNVCVVHDVGKGSCYNVYNPLYTEMQ